MRIALEHHHEAGISGLSRSDYERLRTAIGHPDAPSAKRIATRLGLAWSEVVELAQSEKRDVPRTLGRRGAAPRGAAATALDRERALSALASVATRLGVKKLSAMAYDAERERIAIESHRAATLPTSWQIARLYGKSWTAATRDAGLAPGGRGRRPGVALSDAAELCLHTTGALPTYAELCRFARANYLTIVRAGNSDSNWSTALSDLRTRRDADGLWTPTRPPTKRDRPDYDAPILTSTPRALGRTFWSTEECVRGLIAFLDWLADNGEAGDAATQRRYNRWSAGHPEHPWGKTIIDHGGFTALLDQAIRRRSHPPSTITRSRSRCSDSSQAPANPTCTASSSTPSATQPSPPRASPGPRRQGRSRVRTTTKAPRDRRSRATRTANASRPARKPALRVPARSSARTIRRDPTARHRLHDSSVKTLLAGLRSAEGSTHPERRPTPKAQAHGTATEPIFQ